MDILTIVLIIIGTVIGVAFARSITIVPQRSCFVVERLGKYNSTLNSGIHVLIPFIDKVAYKHSLKETILDAPEQPCVTRDNIQIMCDGVAFFVVTDPYKASYGVDDYKLAIQILAQTTLRSIIGQTDLDKTFEERARINREITEVIDAASESWGVKLLRFEIEKLELPVSIKDALESQMRANRMKLSDIERSMGERQAMINVSEGQKQEVINMSEADKTRQINEAEGRAREIELIARATANGIREIANAIQQPGGKEAVNLRVAEQYVKEFGKLAKTNNTMIIPAELSNIGGAVAGISEILKSAAPK